MARLVAMLVSESVAIDSITNRTSLFHLTDGFNVLPGMLPGRASGVVVLVYERDGENLLAVERVKVRAPSGADVALSTPVPIQIMAREPGAGPLSHISVHLMSAIPIPQAGEYLITLEHGATANGPWTTIGTRSLLVSLVEPSLPHT